MFTGVTFKNVEFKLSNLRGVRFEGCKADKITKNLMVVCGADPTGLDAV
jgi:hypothetical protein